MQTYLYRARTSPLLLQHILQKSSFFDETMKASAEAFHGIVVKCGLLARGGECIGFMIFPDDVHARSWNIYYGKQHGIVSSKIFLMLELPDLS